MRFKEIALAGLMLIVLSGCATTRTVTITTRPPDAIIKVNGIERGRGPVTEQFVFNNKDQIHRVSASRIGFKEQTVQLTRDFDRDSLVIDLKPQTRRVNIIVQPVPAMVLINGTPVEAEPVSSISPELEFSVDARNNYINHTVTAERPGFMPASAIISWHDREPTYVLNLQPMRKDLNITSTPAGATVYLDGERIGVTPLTDRQREFPYDPQKEQFLPRRLTLSKPGYDAIERTISWDNGRSDYHISLQAKTKTVRVTSNPPGAVLKVEGHKVEPDSSGHYVFVLEFPPINEKGELRTYEAELTKTATDSLWEPHRFIIAWDEGRSDYHIRLKEILTRDVPLMEPVMERTAEGWQVVPRVIRTVGMKDVNESDTPSQPVKLTNLPKGTNVGGVAISPDGSRLLYTVYSGSDVGSLRSQMFMIRTDGGGGEEIISDGRTLDMTPSFSPGGDRIVFASNRAGRRMNIWSMSASGAPGVTRLTSGETNDLWPSLDADPKPRLFYQVMVDNQSQPRIWSSQVGTFFQTDLSRLGGTQPRVSPKGDAVLFSLVNDATGNRDIYRMSDTGADITNLTGSPQSDDTDAVWNKDGTRIAFASNRAMDEQGRRHYDIWIMDLSSPERAIRVTSNASHDDSPLWDPSGRAIYFRSNRGGQWNIWKVDVP